MTNFPEETYKTFQHLQKEEFGEGKKVTQAMLEALVENEEYLYKFARKLEDLTSPVTRKIFKPITSIDMGKSYNIEFGTHDGKECVQISDNDQISKIVDFNVNNDDGNLYDDDIIVKDASTVVIEQGYSNNGHARMQQHEGKKLVETITKTVTPEIVKVKKSVSSNVIVSYNRGHTGKIEDSDGKYWWIGYYGEKIPETVEENPYNTEVKSVPYQHTKAISFKSDKTGVITECNIGVRSVGNPKGDMVVEIVPLNNDTGFPDMSKRLARAKDHFINSSKHSHNFKFDVGAQVEKGKWYCLVMYAPLCTYENGYYICGSRKKSYGKTITNAKGFGATFESYNNGNFWKKYINKTSVQNYADLETRPQSFHYELIMKVTKIITTEEEKQRAVTVHGFKEETYNYYPTGTHDCLLCNLPLNSDINQFEIISSSTLDTGTKIMFYASKDGRNFIRNNYTNDGTGIYNESTCPTLFVTPPKNLFIKALLSTTDMTKTPFLKTLSTVVDYEAPLEAYIRTKPFAPNKDQMLSGNVWQNFNVDINLDEFVSSNDKVFIDLIRENKQQETFEFKEVGVNQLQSLILKYADEYDLDIDETDVNTDVKVKTFVDNDYYDEKQFINWLISQKIYLLGKTNDASLNSYWEEITLDGTPSYPILASNNNILDKEYTDFVNPVGETIYNYATANQVAFTLPPRFFNENTNLIESVSLVSENAIDEGFEEIPLYMGTLSNTIPTATGDADAGRHYDFNIANSTHRIVFNIKQNDDTYVFGKYCVINDGQVIGFADPDDSSKKYVLQINAIGNSYTERLDFTTDYDSEKATITWNSKGLPIQEGFVTFTYNPVFCNNITPEMLERGEGKDYTGIKLDLWKETFNVTNNHYIFYLKGYPVNQLREVYPANDEDTQFVEDVDFVVNYEKKQIKFNPSARGQITVEYTPNLTDSELSLGIHIKRSDNTRNCYIYNHSFSYRS